MCRFVCLLTNALIACCVVQILLGIQDLLDNANARDPAQSDAFHLFCQDKKEYERRVLEQAKTYAT